MIVPVRPLLLLAAALVTFAVFTLWPQLDLVPAAIGYVPGQGFAPGRLPPYETLHDAVPLLVALIPLGGLLLWLMKRLSGKAALYLLLAVLIGPMVLANGVFKDNWGRARPVQIEQFGGTKTFTTVAKPADQCERNCAFVSGDAAGGFAFIAPALLLPLAWRRRGVLAGIGIGLLFGVNRIWQGGHFLSDVLFAGYVVGGAVWLLHWGMFGDGAAARFRAWLSRQAQTGFGCWRNAALLLVPLAVLSIAFFDLNMALAMRRLSPEVREVFSVITHLGDALGWLLVSGCAVLGLGLALWRGWWPQARQRMLGWIWAFGFFFVACAGSSVPNSVLKFLFGRTRPKLFFRDGTREWAMFRIHEDWVSMPSGHTSFAMAVATALSCLWPRFWPLFYGAAVLAAVSRVVLTAHWLSDVMIASLVGSGSVLLVRHFLVQNGINPGPGLAVRGQWRGKLVFPKG